MYRHAPKKEVSHFSFYQDFPIEEDESEKHSLWDWFLDLFR